MGSLGWSEMLIIFLVLLLLFGAKRLPELARGLGKSIREFKKATSEITDEIDLDKPVQQAPPPPPPSTTSPEQNNSGDKQTTGESGKSA